MSSAYYITTTHAGNDGTPQSILSVLSVTQILWQVSTTCKQPTYSQVSTLYVNDTEHSPGRRWSLDSCGLGAGGALGPRQQPCNCSAPELISCILYACILRATKSFMFDTDGVYMEYTSSAWEVVIKQTGVWYNYSQLLLYNWMP